MISIVVIDAILRNYGLRSGTYSIGYGEDPDDGGSRIEVNVFGMPPKAHREVTRALLGKMADLEDDVVVFCHEKEKEDFNRENQVRGAAWPRS